MLQIPQIQESFMEKAEGLPILVICATESEYDDSTIKLPSLETLWILAFLKKAADSLQSHQRLIHSLKSILESSKRESNPLTKAADGLHWKLVDEPRRLQNTGLSLPKPGTYQYDVMISYSHKNKSDSHKISEKLKRDQFKIWLDQKEMYGSTMERMAEGVEHSEFLIICMSSTYANSSACQSEATYAKTIKRLLIPIQLEENFTPRGWLGIIVTDCHRVSFTKQSFDDAYRELVEQISRHRQSIQKVPTIKTVAPGPIHKHTSPPSADQLASSSSTRTLDGAQKFASFSSVRKILVLNGKMISRSKMPFLTLRLCVRTEVRYVSMPQYRLGSSLI